MEINRSRVEHAIRILKEDSGKLNGKKIGVLGFTFKENTDDIRESKAIEVIKYLLQEGCEVFVYDPIVKHTQLKVKMCKNMSECIEISDIIIIAGEWKEFHSLENMKISKPIFDLKRLLDKNKILNYRGIGLCKK